MGHKSYLSDYEPVTRARRASRPWDSEAVAAEGDETWTARPIVPSEDKPEERAEERRSTPVTMRGAKRQPWVLKRGHALSYAGLFLYTVAVFFRPYELSPSLAGLINLAFWFALFTLAVYVPTQFLLEGTLTVRTKEVNLLFLLCLAALLSMPMANSPRECWAFFSNIYVKMVIMFIVMVNVVRTQRRLNGLFFLTILAGIISSVTAIHDYLAGNFTVEGYRVMGKIGVYGLFGNPDDMALHLVTMIPIAIALMLGTRNPLTKVVLGVVTLLMLAGTVFSFSRGCFLGLLAVTAVLALKFGRRSKATVFLLLFVAALAFLVLAPGHFFTRILSIFDHSLDPVGSASARQQMVFRATLVALRHPLFGVGIGGFYFFGMGNLGTHNAYLQVAAEVGLPALAVYVMFMLYPLKQLRRIERETYETRNASRFYYLSVGLQASLIGYMVSSTFYTVAFSWYVYYLVAYAVCLRRMYEAQTGATRKEVAGDAEKTTGRLRGRAPLLALDEKPLT